MVQLSHEELQNRYELLCKASQPNSSLNIELQRELTKLESLITQDLVELTRKGCPDNITDILQAFEHELTRFRQFCEFPDLATKSIIGVGGGFSAGKSTFINKLIGKKCLAVEIDPTTSMPTYVLKGEQESIKALNMHDCAIELSADELISLTHEEKELYGSQVSLLLKSSFVSLPEFSWDNLAILDTPGYSKPEDSELSSNTDENLAREQLNTADYILWAVQADSGVISEQDIKFLSTLNKDIPKLVILTRADKKSREDIVDIVKLTKSTLGNRGVSVIDVIPFSRKSRANYPLDKVIQQFNTWNNKKTPILFEENFKKLFAIYQNFIEEMQYDVHLRIDKVNRILAMAEEQDITSSANVLLIGDKQELDRINSNKSNLIRLRSEFFDKLRFIGDLAEVFLDNPDLMLFDGNIEEDWVNFCKPSNNIGNVKLYDVYGYKSIYNELYKEVISRQSDVIYSSFLKEINSPNLGSHNLIKHSELSELDKYEYIKYLVKFSMRNGTLTNEQVSYIDTWLSVNLKIYSLYKVVESSRDLNINKSFEYLKSRNIFTYFCAELSVLSFLRHAEFNNDLVNVINHLNTNVWDCDKFVIRSFLLSCVILGQWIESNSLSLDYQKMIMNSRYNAFSFHLVKNVNITDEVKVSIFYGDKDNAFNLLLCNSDLKDNLVNEVLLSNDKELLVTLSENPRLKKESQIKLIDLNNDKVNRVLSSNPSLDVEFMNLFYEIEDLQIHLSENPSLTVELQEKLSQSNNESIRASLALNSSLGEDIQLVLASDESGEDGDWWGVRQRLASNPSLTEKVQVILANDPDGDEFGGVRDTLAGNISITEQVQSILSIDDVEGIRKTLAGNPSLSEKVQIKLCQEEYDRFGVVGVLTENKALTEIVQLKLFSDDTGEYYDFGALLSVRCALAKNPYISFELQEKLISLNDSNINEKLRENTGLYEQFYIRLTEEV